MVQESVPIAPADAGAALGKAPIRIRETRLCEHFLDHLSGHDRGTLRAAIVKIGEVEVIQSKLIQDRRVNVVDMRRAVDGASSRQLRDSSWTGPLPQLQDTTEFKPGDHFSQPLRRPSHAHGTQSIKDAIRAGIDSIEHASLIDDEGIALAKQHGTFLVFDIYNDDFILQEGAKAGMLPESIEKERKLGKLQRENFRRALLGGARMAFGTDAGVYPHGDKAKQFAMMTEYGMKPLDAIRAATVNAAELLGRSNDSGVVAKDAFADIIAIQGDPRADVKLLENVKFVMKGSRVYKNGWGK